MSTRLRLCVAVCVSLLAGASAFGQSSPNWGTTGFTIYTVGAWAFQPIDPAAVYGGDAGGRYIVSGGSCWLAPVNLPAGAVLDHMELEGCDNSADSDLSAAMVWCSPCAEDDVLFTSGTPGCHRFTSLPIQIGILNGELTYLVKVCTPGGSDTQFSAVRLYYQLEVSPAPGTATFLDVPTDNPYFQFVEALAASGITAGCGGGNFCPDNPVTRGQMAVFLSKALGLYWDQNPAPAVAHPAAK
jgi:S-layer homology domain